MCVFYNWTKLSHQDASFFGFSLWWQRQPRYCSEADRACYKTGARCQHSLTHAIQRNLLRRVTSIQSRVLDIPPSPGGKRASEMFAAAPNKTRFRASLMDIFLCAGHACKRGGSKKPKGEHHVRTSWGPVFVCQIVVCGMGRMAPWGFPSGCLFACFAYPAVCRHYFSCLFLLSS